MSSRREEAREQRRPQAMEVQENFWKASQYQVSTKSSTKMVLIVLILHRRFLARPGLDDGLDDHHKTAFDHPPLLTASDDRRNGLTWSEFAISRVRSLERGPGSQLSRRACCQSKGRRRSGRLRPRGLNDSEPQDSSGYRKCLRGSSARVSFISERSLIRTSGRPKNERLNSLTVPTTDPHSPLPLCCPSQYSLLCPAGPVCCRRSLA